jgi:hypothetical protein
MFGASMKERQKWVQYLINYANHAASGVVNQAVLPVLIVVFNTATLGDGIWDIKEATERADIEDELKMFFQKVHVVRINVCNWYLPFLCFD